MIRSFSLTAILFFAVILLACNKPSPGHGGILSYNEMKNVLWDMVMVDEYSSFHLIKDSTKNLKQETFKLYEQVFRMHHIDSARFFTSFDYYKTHPEDYKILVDSLAAFSDRERESRLYQNRIQTGPATSQPKPSTPKAP